MSRIYYATNRNPLPDTGNPTGFGPVFSPQGLTDLRFGWAEVENNEVRSIEVAQETPDGQVIGSKSLFETIKGEMSSKQKDTVIFIHGFNTSFESALKTAAHFKELMEPVNPINIVVFTWPSDGKAIPWKSYRADRTDAEASAYAVGRGILKLADFLKLGEACGQEMHLMCHSMGSYVARNAVQAMLKMRAEGLPRLFENIFLMAADEDDDALEYESKLLPIIHMTREVYIYFNRGDAALKGSDWTKGNPDRLGSHGPRYPLNLPNKVTLVDCGEVVNNAVGLGHSYFHEDPNVVADVLQVLMGTEDKYIPHREYDPRKNKYVLKLPPQN